MEDDRKIFEKNRNAKILALESDENLFKKSTELVIQLDKYNYTYLWSWMGVPIIQMPADIMATQEVIWKCKPDVIIETGVARGGSVLMLASFLKLIGGRKVIGVDIDIRDHNRESIENHFMGEYVELIEGPSTSVETIDKVKTHIKSDDRIMVVLDSDHSYEHVLKELNLYAPLINEGGYLIVADTLLGFLSDEQTPRERSQILYKGNEPRSAVENYVKETDRFELDKEINGKLVLASSPYGFYKCVK